MRVRTWLMLVVAICSCAAYGAVPASERAALTALFDATNGNAWNKKTQWKAGPGTECNWFGVYCDSGDNHVTQINLYGNNLVGTLPSLSGLPALTDFNVAHNQLTGPIPSLAGLPALYRFDASYNQLSGSLPSLQGLPVIDAFIVTSNQLTGSIPSLAGLTSITAYMVGGNQLTGSFPNVTGLGLIVTLAVDGNQLTGALPPLNHTGVQYLFAAMNHLTGPVPPPPPNLVANQSTLCGNVLTTSGVAAIDAAWSAAAGNWQACQAPTCTIAASPATIPAGQSSVLTASCVPAATNYSWSANASLGSVASGTVSPTATTTYTMTASNAYGPGGTASATVTVTSGLGAPVCNLVPSPPTVAAGQSVTLTAICNPAATQYHWSHVCGTTSTATCVLTPSGTTTYSVFGVNAQGKGSSVSSLVTLGAPAFPLTVSSSVTPASANATALFQPRPQDVGSSASVYVFAHAPSNLVSHHAGKRDDGGHAAGNPAADAIVCVLAQVNSSGQLVSTSASTMQAYVTGVLGSQAQAVQVLNNVPTPNVAGAAVFVGYGTSAASMLSSGTFQTAVSVPGGVQCTASLATAPAPTLPGPLTGLWWGGPNESGWGIHLTQRGSDVFGAWYTYDAAGNPKWYVASNCLGATGASGTCGGAVYEVNGPAFFGVDFKPLTSSEVSSPGSLSLTFSNADNATMTFQVGAVTRTVPIMREVFDVAATDPPAVDYTDLWWNPTEPGWGMAISHQFGNIFLAWYVYDRGGKPMWYVASNCAMSGSSCSGTLYRTTGPPFGPTFDHTRVNAVAVGSALVSFVDANNAVLSYTVDGVTATKAITRELF